MKVLNIPAQVRPVSHPVVRFTAETTLKADTVEVKTPEVTTPEASKKRRIGLGIAGATAAPVFTTLAVFSASGASGTDPVSGLGVLLATWVLATAASIPVGAGLGYLFGRALDKKAATE